VRPNLKPWQWSRQYPRYTNRHRQAQREADTRDHGVASMPADPSPPSPLCRARGEYMVTPTPTRQITAPVTSWRSGLKLSMAMPQGQRPGDETRRRRPPGCDEVRIRLQGGDETVGAEGKDAGADQFQPRCSRTSCQTRFRPNLPPQPSDALRAAPGPRPGLEAPQLLQRRDEGLRPGTDVPHHHRQCGGSLYRGRPWPGTSLPPRGTARTAETVSARCAFRSTTATRAPACPRRHQPHYRDRCLEDSYHRPLPDGVAAQGFSTGLAGGDRTALDPAESQPTATQQTPATESSGCQ
jgi:hypothetical protein